MYTRVEYSVEFISTNWQKLSDLFSELHERLSIREFRGCADPPVSQEYTRKHWHPNVRHKLDGFGEILITNADVKWKEFEIEFFDSNNKESRFIKLKVNCLNKVIEIVVSLEYDRKPEEICDQIISIFKTKGQSKKKIYESSPSKKELEQKFKILFSEPQARKDFDLLSSKAEEEHFQIGVLFIDIDNFKKLNSKYGESKVDKTVLPEAQHLLKKIVRYKGYAYRQGGDEFVVILANYSAKEIIAFAETLRSEFEVYCFKTIGEKEKVTVSIGFAIRPTNGRSYDDVLSVANKAKLKAKEKGGNIIQSGL